LAGATAIIDMTSPR